MFQSAPASLRRENLRCKLFNSPNSTLSHYVLRARSYVVIINTLFYKGILR